MKIRVSLRYFVSYCSPRLYIDGGNIAFNWKYISTSHQNTTNTAEYNAVPVLRRIIESSPKKYIKVNLFKIATKEDVMVHET